MKYTDRTRTVESLAASARMSAQETVSGHSFSSAALISSTTLNPLAEFRFGFERFSLMIVPELSNNTEPSQPCRNKQDKHHFNTIVTGIRGILVLFSISKLDFAKVTFIIMP